MAFYNACGFENNPQFTDDTAACMVWSDTILVMIVMHDKRRTVTSRPIPPIRKIEMMFSLSCENRGAVDKLNEVAAKNGGSADINPSQGLRFMNDRSFADLDGWPCLENDVEGPERNFGIVR